MGNNARSFYKYYNPDYPINIMVSGRTVCDSDYYVHREKSHITALEYISKGSGTLEINGKTFITKQNSAILLTKNSNHTYYSDLEDLMEKQWIIFDGKLAQSFIDVYIPENEYYFENCNLSYFFNEIDRAVKGGSENYENMVDTVSVILQRMFIHIKNHINKENINLPEQIRRYLDANVEERITIEDLCKKFNYSKNHIIRTFKETFGTTPYHYFTERKIDISKLYLCNTKYTVNEISQILKFTDQHYFSAEFKKAVGCSPSVYRKNF